MMRAFLAEMLPWLLSAITIWMTLATGQRRTSGWLVGFFGQGLWFLWAWAAQKWGFLPLTLTLTAIYAHNWWTWRREERRALGKALVFTSDDAEYMKSQRHA